jgi:NADH:ubiquinone oxidoreductase subunit 4 (subunit M)
MQRVFYGTSAADTHHHTVHDFSFREKLMMIPLVLVIIWLGFFPQAVLNTSESPVKDVLLNDTGQVIEKKMASEDLLNVNEGGIHE